jgi:hypothetical protein
LDLPAIATDEYAKRVAIGRSVPNQRTHHIRSRAPAAFASDRREQILEVVVGHFGEQELQSLGHRLESSGDWFMNQS